MKKIIILIVCIFVLGCQKKEDAGIDKIIEFEIPINNYDSLNYSKLYSIDYDIDKNGNNEILLIGENDIDKYIIDIFYIKDDKYSNVCNYKECKINIYDNGIIYNYVINSYYDGMYIFSNLEDINDIYYFKYETDTEYIVYDDKDMKKESKYQNYNELLKKYINNSKKINIEELDMKEL